MFVLPVVKSTSCNLRVVPSSFPRPMFLTQSAPVQLDSFPQSGMYGSGPGGKTAGYGNNNNNISNAHDADDHWKKQQFTRGGGGGGAASWRSIPTCCCGTSTQDDEGPNGKYYVDDFNDYSWTCNVGTTDESGIWLNRNDPAGTIMCMMVWVLLGYSCLTITLLAQTGGIAPYQSFIYTGLVTMALACHIKTTLTDPGSVPASAVPTEAQRKNERLSMCSQCQTFKPPLSHHCRICNRCISRMDRECQDWL